MNKKSPILIGTLMLTGAGFISKIIGFFYRIYLSRLLGSELMGIYHLIFPVFGICFSICSGGMQTALSKFIAAETVCGSKKNSQAYFRFALLISLALAFGCSAVLYHFAAPISEALLHEPRCEELLKILSLSIPLSAVHACIHGYYYGLHKAFVPALSQLVEQAARVAAVMVIVNITLSEGRTITTAHSVYGIVAGEAAATLFCIIALSIHKAKSAENAIQPAVTSYVTIFKNLINLFIPLTSTRLIISILQSLESVFVPLMLIKYGLSRADSLSIYGVLTGMAMPFILFPTAITGSMAVMLLPAVSQANASNDSKKIDRTTEAAVFVSLYMGFLCCGIFAAFGNTIGTNVYADQNAGLFMEILAWLCPFLYISTTLAGTINGLGKPKVSFFNTGASLLLRILFVVILIPRLGIKAYLYGLLASEMLLAFLHCLYLKKQTGFSINPVRHLIKPLLAMAGSIITADIFSLNLSKAMLPELIKLAMSIGWFMLFYIFTSYALNMKYLSKSS